MNDSPYRESGLSEGEPTACLFCGAEHDVDAKSCPKCGVSCGTPNRDEIASSHCPRCENRLAQKYFGRASMSACEKCHGVFLLSRDFTLVLNDYVNGVELPIGVELLPLPPNRPIDRIPIVKCLVCAKEMDRVNFASRSDAIVDVCTMHGLWLDAGDLVPMLHFVKTRAELGTVPLSEAEQEDLIEMDKKRYESVQRMWLTDMAALLIERTLRNRR